MSGDGVRDLLSALWSFLRHPTPVLEDHMVALEQRLTALETRVPEDLKNAVERRIVVVEEGLPLSKTAWSTTFELRSRVDSPQLNASSKTSGSVSSRN
jgi:hypothetical protein